MDFCKKCDNMYYMKKNEDKKLIYYCKNCNYEEENLIKEKNLKVFTYNNNSYDDIKINEYTRYDPSLPHVNNIKCPNLDCESNKKNSPLSSDIIYFRVDDKNMKYLYLCYHCNYSWKPNHN